MSTELEKLFSPDVLAALDGRARRIAEGVSNDVAREGAAAASDILNEDARKAVQEQTLISHKTYLTRAEVAKYLGVSERSVAEWSARAPENNPFPESRAGSEPRYRREAVDEWAEREGRRQRLKLAG